MRALVKIEYLSQSSVPGAMQHLDMFRMGKGVLQIKGMMSKHHCLHTAFSAKAHYYPLYFLLILFLSQVDSQNALLDNGWCASEVDASRNVEGTGY